MSDNNDVLTCIWCTFPMITHYGRDICTYTFFSLFFIKKKRIFIVKQLPFKIVFYYIKQRSLNYIKIVSLDTEPNFVH